MTLAPTKRALALAAAGLLVSVAPAILAGRLWPVWAVYAAAATAALAADGALAPRRRELAWEATVPDTLPMSEGSAALWSLELPGRWPRTGVATLDLSGRLAPIERVRFRLEPAAGAGRRRLRGVVRFPLVPRRRGRAKIERLWLRLPGPLGLVERTLALGIDRLVEIRPNVARVRRVALRFSDRRDYLAGLKIERYSGDGTEFEALREFVPGYDPRSLDWKASARHRRLLCREFRAERNHQVVLALDTGRLMGEPLLVGAAPAPRLDHAIHGALVVAYVALRSGDRVGLYAFDETPRGYAAPRGGVRAFHALQSRTADLEYGDAETNFTLCLTELAGRISRRSLVVVFTDFVDSITAELMAENLARLSRRHLVVFVALRDPLLDALTGARPRALADVQRAVVARELARDRERLLLRLHRAGILALDVAPDRLEPRLLERYLEIKRKELIA